MSIIRTPRILRQSWESQGFGGSLTRFPPMQDLIHWYDFADSSTMWQDTAKTTPAVADNDEIAVITDKGSRSVDLISGAATDPEVDTGFNGRPCASFVAQSLNADGTFGVADEEGVGEQYTMIMVAASEAIESAQTNHYWSSIPRNQMATDATDHVLTSLDAGGVSTATYAADQIMGVVQRNDAGTLSVMNSLDGGFGADFVSNTYGIAANATMRIGAYTAAATAEDWTGNIMEVMWWDRPLSDGEINETKAYLRQKWSMTWD